MLVAEDDWPGELHSPQRLQQSDVIVHHDVGDTDGATAVDAEVAVDECPTAALRRRVDEGSRRREVHQDRVAVTVDGVELAVGAHVGGAVTVRAAASPAQPLARSAVEHVCDVQSTQ